MKLKTFLYSFSIGCSSIIFSSISLASAGEVFSQTDILNENKGPELVAPSSNKTYTPAGMVINDSKVLSYGDNFSYDLQANSTWVIKNTSNQAILGSGKGSISNFNFQIPGDYLVEVSEVISHKQGECDHGHDPSLISIYVSPHKMSFDFSTIQFIEPIIGGKVYTDLQISIEVTYQNYFDQKVNFTSSTVKSAGIQTTFEGILDVNRQNLISGVNNFRYTVSGQATKDTYIMFDFIDINNQVESYSYPTKIN